MIKKLGILFLLLPMCALAGDAVDAAIANLVSTASVNPLRVIGESMTDLTPAFHKVRFADGWKDQPLPEGWELIYGNVIQVLNDGLLVRTKKLEHWNFRDDFVFLKNDPASRTAVDNTLIVAFARRAGRYRYTSTSEAIKTISAYDYGLLPSPEDAQRFKAEKERVDDLAARARWKASAAAYESNIVLNIRETERKRQITEGKIVRFYMEQATNGIGYYQYELGLRYLRGNGVETNMGIARMWLLRAMTNGYPNAITNAPSIPPNAPATSPQPKKPNPPNDLPTDLPKNLHPGYGPFTPIPVPSF